MPPINRVETAEHKGCEGVKVYLRKQEKNSSPMQYKKLKMFFLFIIEFQKLLMRKVVYLCEIM